PRRTREGLGAPQASQRVPDGPIARLAPREPGKEADGLEPAPQLLGQPGELRRVVDEAIQIVQEPVAILDPVHGGLAAAELRPRPAGRGPTGGRAPPPGPSRRAAPRRAVRAPAVPPGRRPAGPPARRGGPRPGREERARPGGGPGLRRPDRPAPRPAPSRARP